MSEYFPDITYKDPRWQNISIGTTVVDEGKQDARLAITEKSIPSWRDEVSKLFKYHNFGHDLPVWMLHDGVHDVMRHPRVMILSEDPLRDHDKSGSLYLSTPFGVHSRSFREQMQNQETGYPLKLAERILALGGVVWMSDFMKFFAYERFEGPKKGDDKKAWNPVRKSLNIGYRELFQQCLKWEVQLFKPNLVITLGGVAADELKRSLQPDSRGLDTTLTYEIKQRQITNNDVTFSLITSYHPSSHGNDCARALKDKDEPRNKRHYFELLNDVTADFINKYFKAKGVIENETTET